MKALTEREEREECSSSPSTCWSGCRQPQEQRHPHPCNGRVPLAIMGLLLTCTSLSVKAQVASNTAAQAQAAGGSTTSTSQINPLPKFNLTAELAALQGINPAELAARTSANARLAFKGAPAAAQSPTTSSGAKPQISNPNPVIAQALLGAFGVPPGPDLPASIGKPTAAASFVLSPTLLIDYIRSQQQALGAGAPMPISSQSGGYGRPGSAPGPAPSSQPAGRSLLQFPSSAGVNSPASGMLGMAGSNGGLPPAIAIAPGVYGVATAPGVYGSVGASGKLLAYRQPGSVPPTRSLETR